MRRSIAALALAGLLLAAGASGALAAWHGPTAEAQALGNGQADPAETGTVTVTPTATAGTAEATVTETATAAVTTTPTATGTSTTPVATATPTATGTATTAVVTGTTTPTVTVTPTHGTPTGTTTIAPPLTTATVTPTATQQFGGNHTIYLPLIEKAVDWNGPDLTISSVRVEMQGYSGGCVNAYGSLLLYVTIANVGRSNAGPFTVTFNGTPFATLPGLAADTVAYIVTNQYVPVGQPVTIVVDSNNDVAEPNEGNNTFSGMLPIPTPPPLCTGTPTDTVTPGPSVTRTATATGTPTAAATGTSTGRP